MAGAAGVGGGKAILGLLNRATGDAMFGEGRLADGGPGDGQGRRYRDESDENGSTQSLRLSGRPACDRDLDLLVGEHDSIAGAGAQHILAWNFERD